MAVRILASPHDRMWTMSGAAETATGLLSDFRDPKERPSQFALLYVANPSTFTPVCVHFRPQNGTMSNIMLDAHGFSSYYERLNETTFRFAYEEGTGGLVHPIFPEFLEVRLRMTCVR